MSDGALLSVEDLRVEFSTARGTVYAVNGISFEIAAGETLGIVGESGCGKSVTSLALLGILARNGRVTQGRAMFDGRDLLTLNDEQLRSIRGREIAMIFQDPMTSLNPVLTIGRQIREPLETHFGLDKGEAEKRTAELLDQVGIPSAKMRLKDYPHQFSGGMRQRAMIAMALACQPKLLIADEPTTALDVTIQAQILNLMLELKEKLGTAIILITHDLGIVAETAQRVIVMYAGRMAEEASVDELLRNPQHPYTRGLIGSLPRRRAAGVVRGRTRSRLQEIAGIVPSLREPIPGCAFAPRCSLATDRCAVQLPLLEEHRPHHYAACWEIARAGASPQCASVRTQS
jgi:peptide/nickel transport system ATP-binding protein